jgi:hypothetical protein
MSTPYESIKDQLNAGDIILFMGSEKDPAAKDIILLETIEGIPGYTHIGIVFKFPGGNPSPDILFWQAAPVANYGTSPDPTNPLNFYSVFGNDYIKGVESDGCVLISLDKLMAWSGDPSKNPDMFQKIAVRQFTTALPADIISTMEQFIRLIDGRSFSSPVATGMPADYAEGALGHQTSNATFFCSKLATLTYQYCGLLSKSIVCNSILPGDYGQNCTNGKISFTSPYALGPEILITPPAPATAS